MDLNLHSNFSFSQFNSQANKTKMLVHPREDSALSLVHNRYNVTSTLTFIYIEPWQTLLSVHNAK
ncbi:hypothetical protein ARAF_3090 [Arsenophonus endosymbiont of Aleurodicus floccissimus]|nr:hypothetical protein ARAF_3090 [Arsenophonus endosymbiont of Aleurodicus floccissimus]